MVLLVMLLVLGGKPVVVQQEFQPQNRNKPARDECETIKAQLDRVYHDVLVRSYCALGYGEE